MTYFEKMKHLEPHMSKSFKEFAKLLYNQVKESGGDVSIERSVNNTSVGLIDGISLVSHGFQFSDDHSLNGSEVSLAQSALIGVQGKGLETIDELP